MGSLAPIQLKELAVAVQTPFLVVPKAPTDNATIFLSNIDQHVFFSVEQLFFYAGSSPSNISSSSSSSTDKVVEIVEKALREVLVPYYFAAGRFRINDAEGRLELDCNAAGVPFAGAQTASRISDLGDLTDPNPLFQKLILYPDNVSSIPDVPPVTIQVTRFACGGFAVGFYVCHVLFDGRAGSDFCLNLASVAQGKGLRLMPMPDRTRLRARSPPCPSLPHPELTAMPPLPACLMFKSSYLDAIHNRAAILSNKPSNAVFFKTFKMTAASLTRLKKKAMQDGLLASCTSFEVLTAHIWQARTKALCMDPQRPSKLFLVVNVRDKLNPPLPEGFAGNGVAAPACVDVKSGDICEKPLSFCVRKVQEIVASANEEYVRSDIDWCELNHGNIDVLGGLIITTWTRLPFHQVDFGWGKPLYAAPVFNSRTEYVLVVNNCNQDGGLNVFVGLQPAQMERFQHYFQV